jgi:hypothetical protein
VFPGGFRGFLGPSRTVTVFRGLYRLNCVGRSQGAEASLVARQTWTAPRGAEGAGQHRHRWHCAAALSRVSGET